MTMDTVAFYSYKGGVGRSLLVANTAQFLALSGSKVVVLDLDLEAPGLHQKLGSPDVFHRASHGSLPGAVDMLLGILDGTGKNFGISDVAINIDLPSASKGSLMLIPAGSAPSQKYWETLEALNVSLRAPRRSGGLPEAVLELQARIADGLRPEFLLIDSRTGITELGGLATSVLADRVVCLTTTAPESIEGTQVVAKALRAAPRLASQQPLRMDFLVTRVTSDSRNSPEVSRLIKELGGDSVSVLPHDSAITNKERVWSGWAPGDGLTPHDDSDDGGNELFAATLTWIAGSFPVHRNDAEAARRRMEAVHHAWRDLTRTSRHVRGFSTSRPAWPVEQLRERVRFGTGSKSRQADIVAYDAPDNSSKAKPLMIIEYLDGEDRDDVAQWWLAETRAPVVAILSMNDRGGSDQRLYSNKTRYDPRFHHSDRWDLPLPHDFTALTDPTDVSVDALLDAVRRGHAEYLDRIVTEWVRCSASGLHGGAPWKPKVARRIEDTLASVEDVELARRVLWATSLGPGHRGMWLGDGDDWLDEQVMSELFAPLLWRLTPEASIELMHGHGRPFGPPAGLMAIAGLARNLLGLRYDPDATFRVEGQRILDRSVGDSNIDDDHGLYSLSGMFRHTEISFEISGDSPPLATPKTDDERKGRKNASSLTRVVSERIASRSMVTTGLLGDYHRDMGRVVLYSKAIDLCADRLALRPRHVGSVTLIHETIHALTHLGRDLDGRMWQDFSLPAADDPLFQPSRLHEALTQYFTHRHIVQLQDGALLHAFEVMSRRQSPAYRAWERLRHLPIEDVRGWFMSVRRGVGLAGQASQVLSDAMNVEDV